MLTQHSVLTESGAWDLTSRIPDKSEEKAIRTHRDPPHVNAQAEPNVIQCPISQRTETHTQLHASVETRAIALESRDVEKFAPEVKSKQFSRLKLRLSATLKTAKVMSSFRMCFCSKYLTRLM
ncbi:MAG TPA: hypothetical protein IAC75_01015 [Candidatus Spyradosoma merdigallinarum]|uniref:Uncharacterized protein n=1 Tax=Candidatus Spyradosoma merdigallinarum TaxID=2840950 RepID=A0A9D1NIA4_9BACT|nr:hypothetical protein [Candidatus Spyradosoma merdigallinarum]